MSSWKAPAEMVAVAVVTVVTVAMFALVVAFITVAGPYVEPTRTVTVVAPSSAVGGMGMPNGRAGSSGGKVMNRHNLHNLPHNETERNTKKEGQDEQ